MEPTIRVSIGTVAFTFERNAYDVLQDYFETLRKHLSADEGADETIKDIEYRLCELFQIRQQKESYILNLDDVLAVLKIMGNPQDFGTIDEESEPKVHNTIAPTTSRGQKKLYRDKDNGLIGGVCSGLSHYFQTDVVIIRLIFLIPLLVGMFNFNWLLSAVCTLYFILWIVTPNASSFEQKVSMARMDSSLAKGEPLTQKKYKGSEITNVLKSIYKAILVILMISIAIAGVLVICSFVWFNFDQHILYLDNYISLVGLEGTHIKSALLTLLILPLVGLFALTYKLFKESAFKTRSLVFFLLGVALWIGAALYIANITSYRLINHRFRERVQEKIEVKPNIETLYLALGEDYNNAKIQPHVPQLLYQKDEKGNKVCIVSNIKILEEEDIDDFQIEIFKVGTGDDMVSARVNARNIKFDYLAQDSLITLNPEWHNSDNPWNLSSSWMEIKVPKNKKVEMLGYLKDLNR